MADVKRVGNGGIPPADRNIPNSTEVPKSAQNATQNSSAVNLPVGQPGESGQPNVLPQTVTTEKIFSDAITGRDKSQLDAAEQMRSAGGVSATDKLLGLHLQPTVVGALAAPPGNMEALRHLTPAMRRMAMRNMLSKQRERTRKLAQFVRRQRDQHEDADDNNSSGRQKEETFIALLTDGFEASDEQVNRATEELVAMAKMLDLLDEMLVLQDYTISQMGAFAQG